MDDVLFEQGKKDQTDRPVDPEEILGIFCRSGSTLGRVAGTGAEYGDEAFSICQDCYLRGAGGVNCIFELWMSDPVGYRAAHRKNRG